MLELLGGGTTTESGENVSPEGALKIPALLCGVRTIAETLASLNIHVFRRGADGSRERDRDHPAAKVLARPNPWTSSYEFKLRLILAAILHGRGLAVAARGGDRIELHLVAHGTMQVKADTFGEPRYTLNTGTDSRTYRWSDVVDLVPLPTGNGQNLSLIAAAREAIGFASVLQKHGARLFKNGARPSGLLSFSEKLNAVELSNYKKLWGLAHGGARSGGTAVFDRGANFAPLALTSVDAQFLELWRFAVLEIARVLRIPPHLVGELERATHNNAEQQGLQFISYCLRPWSDLLEGALARVLFTEEERETYFIETSFDDLVRGDIKTRFDAIQRAVGGPFLTPNEGRAVENRGPIEGGDTLNKPQGVAPDSDGDDEEEPDEGEQPPRLRAVA